jgi:pyruvate carboxylase
LRWKGSIADLGALSTDLTEKYGTSITSTDVLSYCMYPKVFEEFKEWTTKYGDLSVLPTRFFLGKPKVGEEIHIAIEKGKTLIVKLVAISPVNVETGIRDILFELVRSFALL